MLLHAGCVTKTKLQGDDEKKHHIAEPTHVGRSGFFLVPAVQSSEVIGGFVPRQQEKRVTRLHFPPPPSVSPKPKPCTIVNLTSRYSLNGGRLARDWSTALMKHEFPTLRSPLISSCPCCPGRIRNSPPDEQRSSRRRPPLLLVPRYLAMTATPKTPVVTTKPMLLEALIVALGCGAHVASRKELSPCSQ